MKKRDDSSSSQDQRLKPAVSVHEAKQMMQKALKHARQQVERGGLDASFKTINSIMAGTIQHDTEKRPSSHHSRARSSRASTRMSLASKHRLEHEKEMEERSKRKLIDQEMVFKAAMKSNFESIESLELVREGITKIDKDNVTLHRLKSMSSLNLAHNYLMKFENFEPFSNLRELRLSHNKIGAIEALPRMPNLTELYLDGN